jgi:D-alanine-D-alanine ligase
MRIVALIDFDEFEEGDPQFEDRSRAEARSMEFHVVSALRSLGHQVRVIPFDPDVQKTITRLTGERVDLIFNLTEQINGDRSKDLMIASLLELLNIPYTGTGPEGLLLCRDKALSKQVLSHHGLPVPAFASLTSGRECLPASLKFPLLIKPQMGDGSEGISLRSLACSEAETVERARLLRVAMRQPVICEEYIEGRELKICILGNTKLHVFPPREVVFGSAKKGGPAFATARVKVDEKYRKKWQISYPKADLPGGVEAKVKRVAKRIYRLLRIRDYGKIDLRLTAGGSVYFIEANPNPDLSPTGFGTFASWDGVDYARLIAEIVKLAMRRRA